MKIIFKTHFSACVFGFILLMACNTNDSAPTDGQPNAFIEDLIKKMTLEEKIGQLNLLTPGGAVTGEVVSKDVEMKIKTGQVGGIFGIRGADLTRRAQQLAVEQSRLGIPLITGMDVIHGHQTILPIPLGLSCSWDMSLIKQSAQMAAKEATADGLMWTFSPMVDIARDPRWGRISEGSGEDTYLGSKIAAAMVQGYQGTDLSNPMTMLACVKHYAAYGAAEGGRDYAAGDMSTLKLYNEYLPPYKAAVDAGVGSLMNSFNVVDYTPATANTHLLSQVLRKDWGFDGLIVTDYTSINEMVNHGIGDLQEVSARALRVGVDMDMVGEGFLTTLKKSLEEKKISEDQINQACRRVLQAKYNLGLFDDPYKYFDTVRAKKDILSAEMRAFARATAAKTFVLLENKNSILPLKKQGSIAVIGPLADSRRNMLGTWSVSGDYTKAVTVMEGIKTVAGGQCTIRYAKGANLSDDTTFAKKVNVFGQEIEIDKRSPDVMLSEALALARQSDVIIAVVGEAADMTGEAASMADIGLQASQRKLLEALKKTGKPIVMILYNGRPMTIDWESKNMDAILDVWFGGTEGANAVADVLFGDQSPQGRLTTSFPVHVGQIPVYHAMLNTGRPYHGEAFSKFKSNYLDIPNEPLYPFGYGLTYSSCQYGNPDISNATLQGGGTIKVSIPVMNSGTRPVTETVQMYIRDVVGSISRPMKELKGFEQITLQPGESKTVSFDIKESLLKFYNTRLEYIAEPGLFEVFVGPNARDVKKVDFVLKLD
ncbi:MAG: beta-glucosidase BglX [Saprospiraceae bacterium]|jgi:beta-glucosidase|nr:beta-glucosidase BglX [Saprospiraceae bacterium]MBP7923964.1 beta-glucosidase BglX [Saprospiraceae bacterium]MBP8096721.1 beta-glucosidase BglX [Saprospiraceae bacterium]MBP8941961.1 beta-glucosidase BglX [Saprospiraceae bacterium]MBP9744538.1 beta-glucosidase BglX [Saprospiraceae bacterium]